MKNTLEDMQNSPEDLTWEEMEDEVDRLESQGWEIRTNWYPLLGQTGYLCTKITSSGDVEERSLLVNIFQTPLTPIFWPDFSDSGVLSFLMKHHNHKMGLFETSEVKGLFCYCKAQKGKSHVLSVPKEELTETLNVLFDSFKIPNLEEEISVSVLN